MYQVPERFIPKNYQRCTKTIMDNIADPNITFDKDGVCNYYHEYFQHLPLSITDPAAGQRALEKRIEQIKKDGKGKPYDCILGLSGGVDSTYLAWRAKEWGLRPLAVHFDNGWNSELAVKNIENIVTRLNLDLYTHVFDWEQFRDLQLSMFKADVLDIEAVTDIGIVGTLYSLAIKYKIASIMYGNNHVTESLLPKAWYYKDYVNIMDIHKHYGTKKITIFPYFSNFSQRIKGNILGITPYTVLDLVPYNKAEVKETIKNVLGWRDYGGKHYESIFTRFYQGYIVPNKWGIDKRKAHLSNLICSGQITREEALAEIAGPPYTNPEQLEIDKEFVLKKLGFTEQEFADYINRPGRSHFEFETDKSKQSKNKYDFMLRNFVKKILKRD